MTIDYSLAALVTVGLLIYLTYALLQNKAGKFVARHEINTPGRLIRTWKSGVGARMFLSQDTTYRSTTTTGQDVRSRTGARRSINGSTPAAMM